MTVPFSIIAVISRLCAYLATALSVLVLRRRFREREAMLRLPGGPLIPVAAALLSVALLASASWRNLAAGAAALAIGAVVYRFRRVA